MKRVGLFSGILAVILSMVMPLAFTAADAPFDRNLFFGMRNDAEVVRLQEFLRAQGYFTYPQSTGNYYTITLDAVKRFQAAHGIAPIGGYFGPQSRSAANRILSQGTREIAPPQAPALAVPSSPTTFSYEKKIVITSLSGTSANPSSEQLIIENKSEGESISIT